MFDIVRAFIEQIAHNLPQGKLVLLGGIQINMPKPSEDFFHPILFEERRDGKVVDLMPLAFPPELERKKGNN